MVLSHNDSVKLFRNSAPYINAHRGKTFVLMFGGEAVEDANFANIIQDIRVFLTIYASPTSKPWNALKMRRVRCARRLKHC